MERLLWLITIILFVLWLLGASVDWGAWIWFLLVFAIIGLLINVIGSLLRRR